MWKDSVEKFCKSYSTYHKVCISKEHVKIPTHYVRYEELLTDPYPVLVEIFKFILNLDDLTGTIVEKRI
jgi:hypothetical protein